MQSVKAEENSRVQGQVQAAAPTGRSGSGDGFTLCLSGGGYRAMLFHAGALWRLYTSGILSRIEKVSSVSSGSIVAGYLWLKWNDLDINNPKIDISRFEKNFVNPLRDLAKETLDTRIILRSLLSLRSAGNLLADELHRHLFKQQVTLSELIPSPRFIINATNLQSGENLAFQQPGTGNHRADAVAASTNIQLAVAVAASAAFPPFLSPLVLPDKCSEWRGRSKPLSGDAEAPIQLADGGICDRLGLEHVRDDTRVLISDGSGQISPCQWVNRLWPLQLLRIQGLTDSRMYNLRKQEVLESFSLKRRKGGYWSIHSIGDSLPSQLPTRFARLPSATQERIINAGFDSCYIAMKEEIEEVMQPAQRPYPDHEPESPSLVQSLLPHVKSDYWKYLGKRPT